MFLSQTVKGEGCWGGGGQSMQVEARRHCACVSSRCVTGIGRVDIVVVWQTNLYILCHFWTSTF